ncbi:MAG: hypothetical protein DRG82_06240 [Deltaproteobacteria bacterium]|nr:MAG: hypothetical protein DRG82_06240 [Deltaproteobacteria bacterium]
MVLIVPFPVSTNLPLDNFTTWLNLLILETLSEYIDKNRAGIVWKNSRLIFAFYSQWVDVGKKKQHK